VSDAHLQEALSGKDLFDFRPAGLIADLGLLKPHGWSYRETAAYGHFGRSQFPWEKTDKADALRALVS
jgi:S-adenosylmethionine synthetase